MMLSELAFACYLYGHTTNFDSSYLEFLAITKDLPNLNNPAHRKALIHWLNQWGCRQFAVEYHEHASKQILKWSKQYVNKPKFVDNRKNLWEMSDQELELAGEAYQSLSSRIASYKKTKKTVAVSIGPTGAAKILFAIRPKAFPPWDDPIRERLGFDGTQTGYVTYLRDIRGKLEQLAVTCRRKGFMLENLPERIGRQTSSVPKLIDEYYWITITKNISPPNPDTLRQWVDWS